MTGYVPCILLKAIGYVETTGWKQFDAAHGQTGPTVLSQGDCAYGLMQIATGMGGGAGFDPSRVVSDPTYNIGTGARILTEKWNWRATGSEGCPATRIGDQDPRVAENWYYAVWAYNSWSYENNPNNLRYPPDRLPYECGGNFADYPYQERVWGCAAHPPGPEFWSPVPLGLPSRALGQSPPGWIDTPRPSHGSCSAP